MPQLGNLRTATQILTLLKQHIRAQTAAATAAAGSRRFADASQILSTEIAYADTQRGLAQNARIKAKAKAKHAELFAAYTPLEREVSALYETMKTLKNEYDMSARQARLGRSDDRPIETTSAVIPQPTEHESQEQERLERERITIENAMKNMGHLRRATTRLTFLKQYIRTQTAAAETAAGTNQLTKASQILTATISYAAAQKELARTERSQSKNKPKHAALILAYPGLESEVEALYAPLARLKAKYDELEQQGLATELELERHTPRPPSSSTANSLQRTAHRDTLAEKDTPDDDKYEEEYDDEHEVESEEPDEEHDYQIALSNLSLLKTKKLPADLKEPLGKLITHIEKLKREGKEPVSELIEALTKTHMRLTGKLSAERYNEFAATVEGKPSKGLKILGGLMLALGVAALVLGAALLPAAAAAGAAIGLIGLAMGAGGVSFFAMNKKKGLSKAMSDVNEAKQRHTSNEDAPEHVATATP